MPRPTCSRSATRRRTSTRWLWVPPCDQGSDHKLSILQRTSRRHQRLRTSFPSHSTGRRSFRTFGLRNTETWTASMDNVGVTGYRIERCQGTGCTSFAQVAAPAGSGTAYSDTGLTASASYSYRVRAIDAAGNVSGYSAAASATAQAPDSEPP